MEMIELIKKRRSVRVYADKPLAKESIEAIIDAARFAPTARGEQPWEFVVVTEPGLIRKIAEATDYGRFIANSKACIAVFCKDTKYYLEDGSAATQNLMLAAAALGIGSCWVAGDKKTYCQAVSSLLKVPAGYNLVSLIPLGYPQSAESFKLINKRSLNEVIHWEKF